MPIHVLDSITKLGADAAGAVAIAASHGGVYAGYLAAQARLRAVIFSDAGVGLDRAGIGALAYLDALGMPAAAVDHRSARIGDGSDLAARGSISFCNDTASKLGCEPGMNALACAKMMLGAALFAGEPPMYDEARTILRERAGEPQVWGLDSNAGVRPEDAGTIVVTGSHGGLLGGKPETALRVDALAAVYNDAGVGIDAAGISRLPALDARGIAAATVDAQSARIGEARSTWESGVISHANERASSLGVRAGMTVPAFVDCIVAAAQQRAKVSG